MTPRILFVDDDPLILRGIRRALGDDFGIVTAEDAEAGLAALGTAPAFSVVVADLQMPGMDGIHFLEQCASLAPDATRVMLTGNADLDAAVDAVNWGHVFRFIRKPIHGDDLRQVLLDAVARHELVLEERALLEQALTGSTQILVELLSRLDPRGFGRAEEIRRLALAIARQLGLGAAWDIELSALLGPIGRLAIPAEVQAKIDRGQGLDERDRELTLRAPEACARLISRIPRLEQVVDIIRYSAKNYDGSGYPDDLRAGKALPVGSRILKVAQDYVDHLSIRDSKPLAFNEIRSKGALNYDPEVVAALGEVLGAEAELRPQAAPARGFPRRWPPPGRPRG